LTFIITGVSGSLKTVWNKTAAGSGSLTVWNKRSGGSVLKQFGIKEPAVPVFLGKSELEGYGYKRLVG